MRGADGFFISHIVDCRELALDSKSECMHACRNRVTTFITVRPLPPHTSFVGAVCLKRHLHVPLVVGEELRNLAILSKVQENSNDSFFQGWGRD